MKFLWPEMLLLLAAVPALVLLYLWLLRRRAHRMDAVADDHPDSRRSVRC